MGASGYAAIWKTKNEKKLVKMFREARESALHQYGHDPYSGSFGTLDGICIVRDPLPERKQWTRKKIREVTDILYDRAEKWENALAVKTTKGFLVVAWLAS